MKKQSIASIKELFDDNSVDEQLLRVLKQDERKGVQQLIHRYEKQKIKQQELEKVYEEMCSYEKIQFANGNKLVAGVDEAGRGPLAGPVVAAAVILPVDFKLLGLNDSKLLTEGQRQQFFDFIKEKSISYGISIVSNDTIDEINILEATKLAMRNAISQLDPCPDHTLVDAVPLEGLACTSESIIKGDAKSISIAAASILAKVTRDRIMKEIHTNYPIYNFSSNMGYGTKDHVNNLYQYGASPYHRKTFAPVKNIIK
ncbi:RNase HII [Oceanobacillus limi]|uniref:Ribonuclease HII n=1 Tax=Oceanobacillus limi TaxID=930131 RepID=A0A1H9Z1E1_9BACI|nr:ribonuclease HII [Oceanobacillus limi]SES74677.1 RNase HII [Oceanobacillus limi]